MRRLPPLLAPVALWLAWAGPARAGGLQITPVQIDLARGSATEIVALRNGGEEEARYQVSVFRWEQTPAGEMKLAPTEDIVFFPALFALKPGEQRNLRVGTTAEFGAAEKTYRLFVEELPPAPKPDERPQVRVLTRIGIPIFLAPKQSSARAEVTGLAMRAGKVAFRLLDAGTVHIRPLALRLLGEDRGGKQVLERPLEAWYVLAGGERDYEAAVPPETCARLHAVSVEAVLGEKERVTARIVLPPGACGP